MEEMASSDKTTINDVLKPIKGGHLGSGFYGVTFKGSIFQINHEKNEN